MGPALVARTCTTVEYNKSPSQIQSYNNWCAKFNLGGRYFYSPSFFFCLFVFLTASHSSNYMICTFPWTFWASFTRSSSFSFLFFSVLRASACAQAERSAHHLVGYGPPTRGWQWRWWSTSANPATAGQVPVCHPKLMPRTGGRKKSRGEGKACAACVLASSGWSAYLSGRSLLPFPPPACVLVSVFVESVFIPQWLLLHFTARGAASRTGGGCVRVREVAPSWHRRAPQLLDATWPARLTGLSRVGSGGCERLVGRCWHAVWPLFSQCCSSPFTLLRSARPYGASHPPPCAIACARRRRILTTAPVRTMRPFLWLPLIGVGGVYVLPNFNWPIRIIKLFYLIFLLFF